MGGRAPRGFDQVGQTVASYSSYEAAQKAVSKLIGGGISPRDIAIVGTDVRSIERVTGKLGYASAARSGALNGVLLGVLFAAIFVLGTPSPPVQMFVGVMLVGVAVGMLMSLIAFIIVRRRRDYASVTQLVAEHYDIAVTDGQAHLARSLLGTGRSRRTAPEIDLSEPPKYGERIPPGGPAIPPADPPPIDPPASDPDPAAPAPAPGPDPDPAPAPAEGQPPARG